TDGKVKITDFGIARIVSQPFTDSGIILGTFDYMCPEQIMTAKVDGKADQFSLGVIAYRMFAGKLPFIADTIPALALRIMLSEPPPVHTENPAVSARTSEVIGKALAKQPNARFGTCKGFTLALAESLNVLPPN